MKNSVTTEKVNPQTTQVQRHYNKGNYTFNPKNVDVNKLLNRIKINEKKKKKENFILFISASLVISVLGILIII